MAAYLKLYRHGKLRERVDTALSLLESCSLCPRSCGANRLANDIGKCRTSSQAIVSSYGAHFGEEAPLVGRYGSGTIFFANCNLECLFCQNYSISQLGEGRKVSKEELADIMLAIQAQGCHNINLVSPTHVVPQILEALHLAVESGLNLPLVYNSGGYDSVETLKILDGIVDIYMPDMKYDDDNTARQLSGIGGYPEVNKAAVKEMHRQTGDLEISEEGVAQRGLLVRHLVLPQGLAGTKGIAYFLSQEISRNTYVNIMAQYRPCHKAPQIPGLGRRISSAEFHEALSFAQKAGLSRLDKIQPTELLPILSE
ncbi:MAG: radical SAM protein [Dehalococcoidia bacterium]|nr:radical SAM protein [Dehalococcoidia bacterium]MDH4367730.1 radical SAM protein [Dehalococcoidia bacterium]